MWPNKLEFYRSLLFSGGMSMWVESIKLENIKCFQNQEIKFISNPKNQRHWRAKPCRWITLLGENGVGKSTILQALALLLAGPEAAKELLPRPTGWICNPKTPGKLTAVLHQEDGDAGKFGTDKTRKTFAYSYFVTGKERLELGGMVYLDYRIAKNPEDSQAKQMKKIGEEAITKLLPGNVEIAEVTADALIQFLVNGQKVPTISLSDGFRSMIALAGDLIWRLLQSFPNLDDPTKASGVVLIDELDIHLHPSWQREIAGWLQEVFPNLQFFVATHSPLIAAGAGEKSLTLRIDLVAGESEIVEIPYLELAANVDRTLTSAAFGLKSTFPTETENKIKRYHQLNRKNKNLANAARWLEALESIKSNNKATKAQINQAQNKYSHPQVKDALVKMFNGKCAYCESKITVVTYGAIEHFYPKSQYPDLTFTWENLLLSCDKCNDANHKGTNFPLDDITGNPLLIDPTDGVTDPNTHLEFVWDEMAKLASVYGRDRRGQIVEDLFDLNGMRGRKELINYRSQYIKRLLALLRLAKQGDSEALSLLQEACQSGAEYYAFASIYILPHLPP